MIRLVVFAVVAALLTYWFHRRLVRATRLPRAWSIVVDCALVLLWALAVIGMGSGDQFDTQWARPLGFAGWVWLGVGFYLILGLLLVAIGAGLSRLIGALRRRRSRTGPDEPGGDGESVERANGGKRLLAVRVATAAVVAGALVTTTYGVVVAAQPEVVDVSVALPRLPAQFNGLRVALVSDLHVGPARGVGFTERVVKLVNEQRPDVIVIAGDLIDGTVANVAADLEPLADLSAPLGVYGVSGNHEFYADDGGRWLDVWDRLGIRTLRNERVSIERDGESIDIVGIHDHTSPQPYEPDLPAALDGHDPATFTLLVAHEPRQAFEASDLGVDLQVSGHTHGGQMWPFNYLVGLQQPSVSGLDRVGDTVLYTTRGAGAWGPPVRVGAPPEITILELQRKS